MFNATLSIIFIKKLFKYVYVKYKLNVILCFSLMFIYHLFITWTHEDLINNF